MPWFQTLDRLTDADVGTVRRRRYGYIETVDGRLSRIGFRPFPKLVTAAGTRLVAPWRRRLRRGNRCRLYFNQPRRHANFLNLQYVETTGDADYATFRCALTVLDEVARLKDVDALLCDAANVRLTDRLLARLGWAPHAPLPGHRNFIKRRK